MRTPRITRHPAGRLLLAVIAVWAVLSVVLPSGTAQDAIPLVVAGELVAERESDWVDELYVNEGSGLYDPDAGFAERSCEMTDPTLRCDDVVVAYVSPPTLLPVLVPLGWVGPEVAVRALRLVAAASLGAGMVLLWRRLAGVTPRAPAALAVTAAIATPVAMIPIGLGQTSPLMFLSVTLGLAGTGPPRRAVVVGAIWAATVASKAVTGVLGLVLVVQRRWRVLGWGAGLVAAATLASVALGGVGVVQDFVTGSSAVGRANALNPANGSLDSALASVWGLGVDDVSTAGVVARLALVGPLVWWASRLRDDAQWAFAWVALLVVAPFVWWHYSWVALGAVGVALGERLRQDPADAERLVLVLPGLALAGLPVTLLYYGGVGVPWAQWALGVAAVVLTGAFGRTAGRAEAVAGPR